MDVRNKQKAETEDILMGYGPRQRGHRQCFEIYCLHDQDKSCNFQYNVLEVVSRVSDETDHKSQDGLSSVPWKSN